MTLRLRDAHAGDVPELARVINRAFDVEKFFFDGDRLDAAEVTARLASGTFLVAEEDGRMVATVYLELRGERAYFGLLAVAPERQGTGLGRRLVDEVEARARAAGCRAMDIRVIDLRRELPAFYTRLGYTQTGTEPFPDEPGLKQPCCFLIFSKAL